MGNLFTALISWLSAKSQDGEWILRIEDLDPQRSKQQFTDHILRDLEWLGLDWDKEYYQSQRHGLYREALGKLSEMGMVYPCSCTRADIMATQAPHTSDHRMIYPGTCRPAKDNGNPAQLTEGKNIRLKNCNREIAVIDRTYGKFSFNPGLLQGDIVLRRADGAWAYQLAVVVDDATMGITEVVRGNDLLESCGLQQFLFGLLGYNAPDWAHLPLIVNDKGIRLSKRDNSLSIENLRERHTPEQIIGTLAYMASITAENQPVSAAELLQTFKWPLKSENITAILP